MIKIIVVGKIKEKYFVEAVNEYIKRLSKYIKVNVIEIKDSNKNDEGNKIISKISEKDFVVTLDIKGKGMDSTKFSRFVNDKLSDSRNLTFIIGGSDGISNDVTSRSDYSISFSNLTFPHKLFRVMFLEQLYRAFKINNNETYHK